MNEIKEYGSFEFSVVSPLTEYAGTWREGSRWSNTTVPTDQKTSTRSQTQI